MTTLKKRIAIRMMQGKGYKQISEELHISISEIKNLIAKGNFKYPPETPKMESERVKNSMINFEKNDSKSIRTSHHVPTVFINC